MVPGQKVLGTGFGVQDSGYRVKKGTGYRAHGSECRNKIQGTRYRLQGTRHRIQNSGSIIKGTG
jgi:hypothetical protein